MKGAIPVKKQQRNAYIDNRKHRIDSRSCTTEKTEEYRKDQLNWRDDGDELSDASANDYLKGYNMDPYEFKQWASVKHNDLLKTADVETVVMKFTPEFLADRILTLWNGADGPLQNFFEAFTLRYNNNLKEQVAGELAKSGYTVYPRLFDDKPRYARLNKLMKKVAASNDLDTIMVFATNVSKNDSLNLFAGELADLREAGQPVSIDEASGILAYYSDIFPSDYAIKMVSGLMNREPKDVSIDKFYDKDYDFSDESLNKIEDYMNGSAMPQYRHNNTPGGWDFVTDMRSFDGTRPQNYEVTSSKKKQD